jgi:hypothetical protein
MYRTVCAIALGDPRNDIVGSGFLIAPDLVMTNFHVIDEFLDVDREPITQKPGTRVFCIFDYLVPPAPKLPLDDPKKSPCAVVESAENWLEWARPKLPGDGTSDAPADVANRYDYAVIRLARRVGRMPSRRSSASMRGWLTLRDSIEVHPDEKEEKRIIVFQHPQKLPQKFDIGTYRGLDPSLTRVRYAVSTAHGSSGGAAVDTAGMLFALHNSEVRDGADAAAKVNQGIRIDHIARDLAASVPALIEELKKVGDPTFDRSRFWSLSDDPQDPEPILGRVQFRDQVATMLAEGGSRVMVVSGPHGSGVRFSIKLLRRTLGAQVPVVVFPPEDLQRLSPEQFLRVIVSELGILGTVDHPIPPAPATEQVSRWLRLDLPAWLSDRLAVEQARNKARYPAWIVINTVMAPEQRLLWANHLQDFIAALVGVRDPGQPGVDITQLRWLFLTTTAGTLPVPPDALHDEDLSNVTGIPDEFFDCLNLAWGSVEREPPMTRLVARGLAQLMKDQLGNKGVPERKLLAGLVRELLLNARAEGQPV